MTKGETGVFDLDVVNDGFCIAPYVRVVFSCFCGYFGKKCEYDLFTLTPKNKNIMDLDIDLTYCGFYSLKLHELEVIDFLGLFKLRFKDSETRRFVVYPKMIALEKLFVDPKDINEFISLVNIYNEDVSSYSDMREYRMGDPLNRIHWVGTARVGKMLVKSYDNMTKNTITAIIDLTDSKYKDLRDVQLKDMIISTTGAFLEYCAKNEVPVKICYHNNKQFHFKNINKNYYMEEFFNILGEIEFGTTVTPYEILHHIDQIDNSTIIVFTHNFNIKTLNFFTNDRMANNVTLVYPMLDTIDEETENVRQILSEMGVRMFGIKSE